MSDLDNLLAGDAHSSSGAYGKIESPAAQREKDRQAERKAQADQRAIDKINHELQRAGRERENRVGEFMRNSKPSQMAAPLPLAGNQNIQPFGEKHIDTPVRPEEWRPPVKNASTESDSGLGNASFVAIGVVDGILTNLNLVGSIGAPV